MSSTALQYLNTNFCLSQLVLEVNLRSGQCINLQDKSGFILGLHVNEKLTEEKDSWTNYFGKWGLRDSASGSAMSFDRASSIV